MRLTLKNINDINTIDDINKRRDAMQNLVIQEWFKKPRGILTAFTSFGKSYCIAKVISIVNQQQPDSTVCIIVPTSHLKNDMEEIIEKFSLKNTEVHVVNSFSMNLVKNNQEKYYDLLICDELHTLSNENSKYFSEVIPRLKYKYFFGVSATLEKSHLEYLKKYDLDVFFDVPLEDGYRTGVVPEYIIYNIPVQLTDIEKLEYAKIQRSYNSIVSAFTLISPLKPIEAINAVLGGKNTVTLFDGQKKKTGEWAEKFAEILDKKPGVVMFMALQWQKLMGQRRTLLNNCENSQKMIMTLTHHINTPAVIVCSSIDTINAVSQKLPESLPLHSKLGVKVNRENKRKFTNGEAKYLLVVKGLKEGYNNKNLRILIRQGYTSKALDLTQYLGRLLRFDASNPDKLSILVNIYVEDFYYNNELIESQQKKWLKSSVMGKAFVEWIKEVKQIEI